MLVTLNMLLDCIKQYPLEIHISSLDEHSFARVALLPEEASPSGLSAGSLYVCRLSDYLRFPSDRQSACYICVRDRLPDSGETPERLSGSIIISANVSYLEIFSLLSEKFMQVLDWWMRMTEAMMNGCTLQTILEMSRDMIGNYIAVNDAAFKLVANTANIPCDDPLCRRMVEYGFHPESTIDMFKKTGRFNFWEKNDFYIDNDNVYSPYSVVGQVFRIEGNYVAHAVMTCNNYEATQGLLDLYKILCTFIAKFCAHEWESKDAKVVIYSTFLEGLIEGKTTDYASARERLAEADFPAGGEMCVLRIPVSGVANTLVGIIGQAIADLFPRSMTSLYSQELILLLSLQAQDPRETMLAIARRVGTVMERYDLQCGISSAFRELELCPNAYKQSGMALHCGVRLSKNALVEDIHLATPRVSVFDELLHYCMLQNSYEVIQSLRSSRAGRALTQLAQYDKKHSSNNMELLYNFLRCERRAKETGELMHLHRNSVVYRVEHIRAIVDLGDLEDPDVRFRLLVSFMMINLYGIEE